MKYERYPDELVHYGVLGMKWGIRRSRNKVKSKNKNGSGMIYGSNKSNKSIINKKTSDKIRSVSNSANKFEENTQKINRSISNIQKKRAASKIDLSNMSDKELRDRVNRMNTEQQYIRLSTENVGRGRDYVMDAISIGAGAIGIASSALSIAVAIKELKKK